MEFMDLAQYYALGKAPGDRDLVFVGERPIVRWRINERPDKSIPICAVCETHWTYLDGTPSEPGEGLILRCKVCGLDCT